MSIMETGMHTISSGPRVPVTVLIGGIIGLIVAMGIGRFAFTPILPLMQRDLGLTNSAAGWLAGLNYLGYLVGAIAYSVRSKKRHTRAIIAVSGSLVVLTTVGMAVSTSLVWWGCMRFISGVSSALLFVIIAAEVNQCLNRYQRSQWNGVLYSGVGIGIAMSGLIIPALDVTGGWKSVWISMGVIAFLFLFLWAAITVDDKDISPVPEFNNKTSETVGFRSLVVAYFFEGLGYVVSATFLVAIVAETPGFKSFSAYCWVFVGVAAIPSTIIWPLIATRIGRKGALSLAYVVQAIGILISVNADTIIEVCLTAVIFGGTFMGITALILIEGQSRMSHNKGRAAAILTASFGTGQIIGPIIAGYLADLQGDFTLPLLLAAISVIIGCVFIESDPHYVDRKEFRHAIR